MESWIADFVQFSGASNNFLLLEGRLRTRLWVHLIWDFPKSFSFPKIVSLKWFNNSSDNSFEHSVCRGLLYIYIYAINY